MTLAELLLAAYARVERHTELILIACAVFPVAGALLARWGKGGRTETDGRAIASAVVGVALSLVLLELAAILVAQLAFEKSFLDARAGLLLAPVLCLAGCLVGIRWVFPLNELGSVRTFTDVVVFLLACAAVLWFFSRFRGWGILFLGGLFQLLAILALGAFIVHRLFRRITGGRPSPRPQP